jgi:hypothetical protein
MRRVTAALALSAALLAGGGCTDRYGRVDYGRTALLGVGVGAAAALTAGALADKPRSYYGSRRSYYGDSYGYGYGPSRGYGYGYSGYGNGYGGPRRGYYW